MGVPIRMTSASSWLCRGPMSEGGGRQGKCRPYLGSPCRASALGSPGRPGLRAGLGRSRNNPQPGIRVVHCVINRYREAGVFPLVAFSSPGRPSPCPEANPGGRFPLYTQELRVPSPSPAPSRSPPWAWQVRGQS